MNVGNIVEFEALGAKSRGRIEQVEPLRIRHLAGMPPGTDDGVWTVVKLDDVKKLKCPTCGGTDFRNDGKVIICVPPGKGCVSASADVLIPEAARVPN